MIVRLLFGKPLPGVIPRKRGAVLVPWMPMILLVAGAGLIGLMVMRLLMRGKNEMEQMVFH